MFLFFVVFYFIPGVILLPASNVIIEGEAREKQYDRNWIRTGNRSNNYFLFAPLCDVHTGWFGGLVGGLFASLLLIFGDLLQALGGDTKGRFGEVCKTCATGATSTIFNGPCDLGSGTTTITIVGGFLCGFNFGLNGKIFNF